MEFRFGIFVTDCDSSIFLFTVVNCQSIMTCSGCVREDCWWLVFKNYTEQCSPVLAGVPNVHEWFYGPGSCRQFHCVHDEWDVYGELF